jgi:hypothetical protein
MGNRFPHRGRRYHLWDGPPPFGARRPIA